MSDPGKSEERNADEEIVECWCGARGKFRDMFDVSGIPERCGGFVIMQCLCGGDQCVCHHHGEIECPGCDECCEEDD